MNVKLVAFGVLLVQSGALLVSGNYKLAYSLQTPDLGWRWRYTGWYLHLSNVKPTQDGNASAASQPVPVLLFLLYNAHSLPGVQTYWQSVNKLCHKHYKPTREARLLKILFCF
jgi:hypothetical protein